MLFDVYSANSCKLTSGRAAVGVGVGVRHHPISQRVLQRRNSENALQHAMNVAAARKETLLRLLAEHDQLVHEVARWSELAETDGGEEASAPAADAQAGSASAAGAVPNGPVACASDAQTPADAAYTHATNDATIPEEEAAN